MLNIVSGFSKEKSVEEKIFGGVPFSFKVLALTMISLVTTSVRKSSSTNTHYDGQRSSFQNRNIL